MSEISKLLDFIVCYALLYILTVNLRGNNIFKVLKVPKKAVQQEKPPVAVPKISEPSPAKGTCHHYSYHH